MKPALVLVRCVVVLGFFLALTSGVAAAADLSTDPLTATVRELEKKISEVRGLEYKTPVAAKKIPRPKDADRRLQGYYSIQDKTLYVYDDVSGAYERGVLIHEMVHALQNQHFGLEKLHQDAGDDDAALAKDALIEGDATYTMIEVLKKDQPKVGRCSTPRWRSQKTCATPFCTPRARVTSRR